MTTNTETVGSQYSTLEACLSGCRKVLAQINRAKDAVLAEFRATRQLPEHLLQLAINEAEALAWQTAFPQLVFPDLAAEKAQALVAWQGGQNMLSRGMALARTA